MYPGECKACTFPHIPKVGWVPTGWLETTHSHYCPNHNYHPSIGTRAGATRKAIMPLCGGGRGVRVRGATATNTMTMMTCQRKQP